MAKQDKLTVTKYLRERRQQKDLTLKYDFMPPLLEIVERPAHRAGKWVIAFISLLLVTALVWASFSKIDIVVIGQGSLLPKTELQSVGSSINGIVKDIKVREGQQVKRGDTLVELDDELLKQTIQQLEDNLLDLKAQEEVIQTYQADKQAVIDLSKYPSIAHASLKSLVAENASYQQELAQAGVATRLAQYEATLAQRLANVTENRRKLEIDLAQQKYSLEQIKLVSPTDGLVNRLQVNHTGQLVGAGNSIVSIVPTDSELIFEGQVSDKDRASLKLGMKVVLKLQAYPYSDYGTIPAKVTYISPTASQVRGQGMVYLVRLSIYREKISSKIDLTSGLTGTVEMKTGSRSVLDYFLDPIKNEVGNSLKER